MCTAQPALPLTFTHYSMTNGLVSNEIRSVVQDRTGYIWIASNYGLQRYDGVNYRTFQHRDNDSQSLPQNAVLQLLIDNDDNLWVVTANSQVGIFDKSKFTFTDVPVRVEKLLSLWAAKSLIKDEYGNLFYLLQGHELLAFDKKKKEFSAAANFIPFPPNQRIMELIQEPGTKKYWLGLPKNGLAIFNRQTGKLSYFGHNIEQEKAIDSLQGFQRLSHFMFDKNRRLWMVSWQLTSPFPAALCFDRSAKQKVHSYNFANDLRTYYEIHGFLQQRDGAIWAKGAIVLSQFDEEHNRFDLIPSDSRSGMGIVYEQVTTLFEDREKNVWVATGNNGLYRCNPSQQFFNNIYHLNGNKQPGKGSIMSFMELKNGDILAGSWGDGLFRYNRHLQEKPLAISDPVLDGKFSVWHMCASADSNTIWMACQPGINQYDQAKGATAFRNPAALQNRTVRQVAEDRQGNLWLGMHYFGLFKWLKPKTAKKDSVVRIPEVGTELVTRVVADNKGFIWVTTEKKGVFAFESETGQVRFHWNNRREEDSLKIVEGFHSVLPYNDSLVYIATASRLYRFNRITNKLVQQPLPGSLLGAIQALEKDENGLLWISTENGIYRFNPAKRILVFFNREDGIANDRFIPAASYRLRDGRLLFGSDNTFIYFQPSQVTYSNNSQRVIFTSIQAGKKELPVDSVMKLDLLRLDYVDNSLDVNFSALNYAVNSIIQYKMEGLDNVWRSADKDNKTSFPFLPPNKYTLLLRTMNTEGASSPVTSLKIIISAPFYQTWWFYMLIAMLSAAFLFWLDRQRTKRKEALQKVRTDIAGGLHQEVNTALNNINILSEIARLKSEREPAKARDYIEQIHTKSHNMIIALDDMLWSLDPENDAMEKTIQRIREFADALMQRSGANIELLIDKRVERLQLNMKLRHESFLLFKEGLRSLIDAGTRHCIVHLTIERGKLFFTIEFANEGCDMQKLNNLLQRHDLEDRLHELKAKLDVQVHKSRSMFLLQLPL